MKPDPLEQALASYARQLIPSPPNHLTADVWGEIDRRRRRSVWTHLLPMLEWRELFAEPRLVVSAIGLALAIGFMPAFLLAKQEAEKRLVRESLHFEVFSSHAPLALLTRVDAAPGSGIP